MLESIIYIAISFTLQYNHASVEIYSYTPKYRAKSYCDTGSEKNAYCRRELPDGSQYFFSTSSTPLTITIEFSTSFIRSCTECMVKKITLC